MAKLLWVIAVCAAFVVVASAQDSAEAPAPAPNADCSLLIYDMIDCISFISVGGTEEKPSGSCCSSLKSVVNTDADCVCEALKSSAQLGIDLNMTRAMALPSACGVSSSSLSTCDISATPDTAPVSSPVPVPVPDPAPAPGPETPTESSPNTAPAPAPAPAPDSVLSSPPEAPVVEPPAQSPSSTNGGSSSGQSPALSTKSGTLSATIANPCLLLSPRLDQKI